MTANISKMLLGMAFITSFTSTILHASPDYDTTPDKAEEYRLAAEKGNPIAKFNFGYLTAMGWAGLKEDKAKANDLILQSAGQGYAEAQLWVARLHLAGEITGKYDLPQSAAWLARASQQGDRSAHFLLGLLHQEGNEMMSFFREVDKKAKEFVPLEQDKSLTKSYWSKAGLRQDQLDSLIELHVRVSRGDWRAHAELSEKLNSKALREMNSEIFAAYHWIKYSRHLFDHHLTQAKAGDVDAMLETAKSYRYPGCPGHPDVNPVEELLWLRQAEKAGSVVALYELGAYYSQDEATKNPDKSFAYYKLAAEQGHPAAMCSMAIIYEGKEDLVESTRWMIKAAEAGDSSAWFYVGHRYQNGKGIPVNFVRAYAWFSISAMDEKEGEDGPARRRLKQLAGQMTADKVAEAQQLSGQIWERLEKRLSGQRKPKDAEEQNEQLRLDLERARLRSSQSK